MAPSAPAGLPIALRTTGGFYSPTWCDDGKKLLVHNMSDVFIIDLTGNVLNSMPITQFRKDPAITSASRYLLSRDETNIIFDMDLDASNEDSPAGIYVYNRKTQKISKITPAGYSCFHPVLKGDRIFFCGWKVNEPSVKAEGISALDGNPFSF